MKENITEVNVVGGGLAGVECANLLANHGIKVNLYEMKPIARKNEKLFSEHFLKNAVCMSIHRFEILC